MKTCNYCHQTKETKEFHADRSRKDGLQDMCKTCSGFRTYYSNYSKHMKELPAWIRRTKARSMLMEMKLKGTKARDAVSIATLFLEDDIPGKK